MILIYLLKVSACTAIFFAVYQFLLSKLTFFNLNRAYLLVMLVLCFAIPAVTIQHRTEVVVSAKEMPTKIGYSNEGFTEKDFVDDGTTPITTIKFNQILEYGYYTILALLIFRMLLMMGRIKFQLRKHAVDSDGVVILVDERSVIKNCSFFNKIIVDSALPLVEKNLVIKHESIHVKQLHALDKMLVNIVTAVLWFNPVVYFWRNAIDHNHEFLADRETSKVADKKTYASLLLNLTMPSANFATNSFSKLPLKNRIMMLYKEPNAKLKKLSYLAIVPILLICCLAFVNRKEVTIQKTVSDGEINSDVRKRTNIYAMNYLAGKIAVNPDAKPAFKEIEAVLVVDAGHGGKDAAATAVNGQREKDLNLRAVKILQEEATRRGIKVMLTRNSDQYMALRDRLPKQQVTAFISIHHNSMPTNTPTSFGGIEVYVSKLNNNIKMAEELGGVILNKLRLLKGIAVRDSLKDASLLVLRESKSPAVLIELGNISDEKSLNFINEQKNIRRICNLILDGFVKFSERGC
ncbi:N-acetylmuramoyl-L-alanine amidase [Pedobacter frigidisoli]|uniref:N-acetylmuramoyl-L-alanine amidase n=1 Tax=Pedobacter frigidisoli TaxID=2530455 RepID=A0A4R0P9W3_9SPHI|nr:N-acetylmuramoyl-L-alanine amidase [Pedobacter frigidisoli]TCD12538.1 N-acetylmuramoyl-L-alanine amidase [Pedobacter frigidisoli]